MADLPTLERKYKSAKKKVKALREENLSLITALDRIKQRAARLQKERSFLLDRLLRYEDASDDGEDASSESDLSDDDSRFSNSFHNHSHSIPHPKVVNNVLSPNTKIKDEAYQPAPSRSHPPLRLDPDLAAPPAPSNGKRKKAPSGEKKPKKPRAPADPSKASLDSNLTCIATGKDKTRTCKSKALSGLQYCWHHAPLDPNSGFIFCQYLDPTKKMQKKCNIPVPKSKNVPYCNYHEKLIIPRRQRQLAIAEAAGMVTPDMLQEIDGTHEFDVAGAHPPGIHEDEEDLSMRDGEEEDEEEDEEEEETVIAADEDSVSGEDAINPV